MNENVNPDNVNPHFNCPEEFGLHNVESKNVETSGYLQPHFDTVPLPVYPVGIAQPCPSCGHCPTCGRGPSWPVYRGPWWGVDPGFIQCDSTSGGEGATVHFGKIS